MRLKDPLHDHHFKIGPAIFTLLFLFSFKQKELVNITKEPIVHGQEYRFTISYCKEFPTEDRKPFCEMEGIDSLLKIMRIDTSFSIIIEIHSPSLGKESVNLKYSQNKANAISDYLIKNGINNERIEAVGMGNLKPYIIESDTTIKEIKLTEGTIIDKKFIDSMSMNNKYEWKSINTIALLSRRNIVRIIKK